MRNITNRSINYVDNNAAYAGGAKKPWHANGNEVDPDSTIEEWQEAAGLDYEILALPSQYTFKGELKTVKNRVQLVRSDNGVSMSEMSGSNYKIRQPAEIVDFFRQVVDNSNLKMRVLGTMQEGKKIFGLAESGNEAEIGKGSGDLVRQNVFFIESFDGTHATKATPTMNRLFCLNQINALAKSGKGTATRRHSQDFDVQGMLLDLATLNEGFANTIDYFQAMTQVRMTLDMQQRFFAKLLAPEAFENDEIWMKSKYDLAELPTARVNRIADLLNCVGDQPGGNASSMIVNRAPSLYGVLNAVTYYHDHEGRTKGDRSPWESAMIGNGAKVKQNALDLAVSILG